MWTGAASPALDGTIVCYAGPQQLPRSQGAAVARPPAGRCGGAGLRRHAADAGDRSPARSARSRADAPIAAPALLVVGARRGAARAPALVRRAAAVRQAHPGDAAARAGRRARRAARGAMGAEAIEAPMIRIVPPDDYGPLDEACAQAGEFDWIVFSSANAVDAFIERLLAARDDLRALKGVKLCAVGPATAERLARHGLKVDLTPAEYRAEAVARRDGRDRRRCRAEGAAAARRHRPRADRRRTARSRAPTSPRSSPTARCWPSPSAKASPTSTGCCSSGDRRRHVHQRVGGPQLRRSPRRRAGRRSAAHDGRRLHRTGDGGSRARSATSRRRSCRRSYTVPALVDAIVEALRARTGAAAHDSRKRSTRTHTRT